MMSTRHHYVERMNSTLSSCGRCPPDRRSAGIEYPLGIRHSMTNRPQRDQLPPELRGVEQQPSFLGKRSFNDDGEPGNRQRSHRKVLGSDETHDEPLPATLIEAKEHDLAIKRVIAETEKVMRKRFRKWKKQLREQWKDELRDALADQEQELEHMWEGRLEEAVAEVEQEGHEREQMLEGDLEEVELALDAAEMRNTVLEDSYLAAEEEIVRLRAAQRDRRTRRELVALVVASMTNRRGLPEEIPQELPRVGPAAAAPQPAVAPVLECIACMAANKTWMCSPCRHLVYCDDCVRRVRDTSCPVCRERCRRLKKVYL